MKTIASCVNEILVARPYLEEALSREIINFSALAKDLNHTVSEMLRKPVKNEERMNEKLIDFCLANKPITEGCDVVDYIYVLYRCTKQTNYKKEQIVDILNDSISEIKKLYHSDSRGFSYYENMSQTTYYGVPITTGKKSADIHGTLLCTWALMMILDVNNELDRKYRIIKP